jgi:hypothetical protein
MTRRLASWFAPASLLLAPGAALGCPNCVLGRQVRAAVLAGSFGTNLLAVAVPTAAVVMAAGLLRRMSGPPQEEDGR